MKKSFLTTIIFSAVLLMNCSDDKTFLPPNITAPGSQALQQGSSLDITFAFEAEAGFASSSISFENGSAEISTDGEVGTTTGTIVVTFNADAASGAASVTLTITDDKGEMDQATAVKAGLNRPPRRP